MDRTAVALGVGNPNFPGDRRIDVLRIQDEKKMRKRIQTVDLNGGYARITTPHEPPKRALIHAPGSVAWGPLYTWIHHLFTAEGYAVLTLTVEGSGGPTEEWRTLLASAYDYVGCHIPMVEHIFASGHSLGANMVAIEYGDGGITAMTCMAIGWCSEPEKPDCDLMNMATEKSIVPILYLAGEKDMLTGAKATFDHWMQTNARTTIRVDADWNHINWIDFGLPYLAYRLLGRDGNTVTSHKDQKRQSASLMMKFHDEVIGES